jgi:hypothetical protein
VTTKLPMVGWYNPTMLVQTGIRVAISTIFGRFSDKREALAVANVIEPNPFDPSMDYAANHTGQDFWFDFIADTGDGWNSTYAVARLLAQEVIRPAANPEDLPRGTVLIMGGDQVYPTASREEYGNRLLGPFDAAYQPTNGKSAWNDDTRPDLYAVPGNHDWYDGLSAFFGLFCRRRIKPRDAIGIGRDGRIIGGRQTLQTRSYFAIRLPGNWWLWGTDSQLEGYIDQPQIDYFQYVAKEWMAPGSKLILCVGQPSWEYLDTKKPETAFRKFSYLERLAGMAVDVNNKPLGHQLKLILTGDSHHYARYVEHDRHYITCGGGGAFLHPTHHIEDKQFSWDFPEPGVAYDPKVLSYPRDIKIADTASGAKALYPDRHTSWLLTLWNFAFAFKNWKFPATLVPLYFLFSWLLDLNSRIAGQGSLAKSLASGGWTDAMCTFWLLVIVSPMPVVLVAGAIAGFRYFSDVVNPWGRTLVGGLHAAAHGIAIAATTSLVIRCTASWWDSELGGFLSLLTASAASAFVSASVMGAYLFVSLAIFKRHWNEAFSSFAHQGFKSILRLKINAKGELLVYPIGLDKVPNDRSKSQTNPPLKPHLIEGPVMIG